MSCCAACPGAASPSSACAASSRCSTRWRATSDGRASSSPGRATGSTTSGCTRPRSGWRCSTPRPSCWPAIRRAPRPRSPTPSASRARSAIAGSSRRSCVDRAHVLLAQDRLARGGGAPSPRIDEVPAPSDLEWRIKRLAARGKLAAREGHAERGARGGAGRRRARRPVRHVPLPRRRLARPGRGGRARGRGRGGGGRPRDGAAALSRQGQRRRRAPARALPPPRRATPSRWTAGARRAPSVAAVGSRAPRPGPRPAPRRPPSRAP